jgi:hypothetical protein
VPSELAGLWLVAPRARLARANPKAWRHAFVAALPPYVVLLALVLPRASGDDRFTAVELAVPVVLAAVAVGSTASESERVWGWRSYLGAVSAVAAAAMTLALLVREAAERSDAGQSGDPDAAGAVDREGSTLWIPDRAGSWTLVDNPGARERERELLDRWATLADEMSVAYGEYRRGTTYVRFRAYNSNPGSAFGAELRQLPAATIRDYMSAAHVRSPRFVDSGNSAVSMACGEVAQTHGGLTLCVWADAASLGSTVWIAPDVNIDRAANLTRSFRPNVSRPSG